MTGYRRFEGETDEALILRICNNKENIGTWEDVCKILNELLGEDKKPNTYRNKFQSYNKMFDGNVDRSNLDILEEIKEQRRELAKDIVRFRDERNEYNKIIRREARKESYIDLVKRVFQEYTPQTFNYIPQKRYISNTDMVLLISDLHCGITVNHYLNKFNPDILSDRFTMCLDKIIAIQNVHKSDRIVILISEIISGLIHENMRCDNNQNIIEQFLTVSQYLGGFIMELSKHFNQVDIMVMPGNHSRITAKKEESLKGENIDNLLIPYLTAMLQNIQNVTCCPNKVDESIAMFNIRGHTAFAVHGDKDTPNNVVQNLTMQYSIYPDFVFMGHRHKNSMETIYNTKVISAGCWSGVDNYAIDKRYNTKPETTLSIIDDNGLVCNYDIALN